MNNMTMKRIPNFNTTSEMYQFLEHNMHAQNSINLDEDYPNASKYSDVKFEKGDQVRVNLHELLFGFAVCTFEKYFQNEYNMDVTVSTEKLEIPVEKLLKMCTIFEIHNDLEITCLVDYNPKTSERTYMNLPFPNTTLHEIMPIVNRFKKANPDTCYTIVYNKNGKYGASWIGLTSYNGDIREEEFQRSRNERV